MIDKRIKTRYNNSRKGKTSNGYAKLDLFKIALTLVGGGYFFMVIAKSNICNIIDNI